jgi:hypothetical protein
LHTKEENIDELNFYSCFSIIHVKVQKSRYFKKHEFKIDRDTVSLLQATAMTGLDIYGYDTTLPDSDDEPFSDID